jgi:hypothetical protein
MSTTAATPAVSAARAGGAARSGASAASALGNTAISSSTVGQRPAGQRERDRRRRRAEALSWRSRLWSWTSLARLRNCGRVPFTDGGGAVLRLSETNEGTRAGIAGLQSCGPVWSCPVCARRISAQRARELREVLETVRASGGSVALVTLTMRHRAGQQLGPLWEALSGAWGAVTSGRGWTADQATFGIRGWCRVVGG